jgi:hypothetical protein
VTWMFVERALEEAARAGKLDVPPGGPIDLSENPYVPADWRLAVKLLKDHGVVPEVVERRREIEAIRAEFDACPTGRPAVARAILVRLNAAIEALNRGLLRENQFVRNSLQMAPVDVEAALRSVEKT